MKDAKFLLDSGLLFEINRRVLHPLGLALVVIYDEETDTATLSQELWEVDDPEGIIFDDDLLVPAEARLKAYMDKEGDAKHLQRKKTLGYVVQEGKK